MHLRSTPGGFSQFVALLILALVGVRGIRASAVAGELSDAVAGACHDLSFSCEHADEVGVGTHGSRDTPDEHFDSSWL
ncbi:hypothetical protein C2E23DRAFT_833565 [Lenzites betulinus]|nr:hypothetical protein C2E23DRAFT_833565 [Lenzites betulinus]